MEIGSTVFCLDAKSKKVFEGILVGSQLSTTGYELRSVLNGNGEKKNLEEAHVFAKKADAEKHLERVAPIMEEADKIVNDAKVVVDALRIKVIGKPKHEELANKIMGTPQAKAALAKKL